MTESKSRPMLGTFESALRMRSFRAAFIGVIGIGAIGSPALAAQALGEPFNAAYQQLRRGTDHLGMSPQAESSSHGRTRTVCSTDMW